MKDSESRQAADSSHKGDGKWYVTEECIACDACVLVAEKHFKIDDAGERAYLQKQPQTLEEEALCVEAMEACPVEAIQKKPAPGGK